MKMLSLANSEIKFITITSKIMMIPILFPKFICLIWQPYSETIDCNRMSDISRYIDKHRYIIRNRCRDRTGLNRY